MVLVSSAKEHIQKRFTSLNQKSKEIYHRIDKRQNNGTYYCKVFNQLATKGRYNILVVCWVPSIWELFTKKNSFFSCTETAVIKITSNAFRNSSYYYMKETENVVLEIEQFLSYELLQPPNKIFEVCLALLD